MCVMHWYAHVNMCVRVASHMCTVHMLCVVFSTCGITCQNVSCLRICVHVCSVHACEIMYSFVSYAHVCAGAQ